MRQVPLRFFDVCHREQRQASILLFRSLIQGTTGFLAVEALLSASDFLVWSRYTVGCGLLLFLFQEFFHHLDIFIWHKQGSFGNLLFSHRDILYQYIIHPLRSIVQAKIQQQ